jgi:hypothetical protein
MSVPPRVSVITLGARDVPGLREFYERLGWRSPSPPGDEFAHFETAAGAGARVLAAPADRDWGGRKIPDFA